LRSRPSYRFIDADAFVRLAVSLRRLTRADDPTARLRGLLDLRTGERFLTEEEKLFGGERDGVTHSHA
jgi:hypothetical protein